MEQDTFQRQAPVCPHCGHELNDNEMQCSEVSDADLYALAPNEESATVVCPVCDLEYWVQGGYRPYYTSALAVDDLDRWCGHASPHASLIARHLKAIGEDAGYNAGTPVADEACNVSGLREQLRRLDYPTPPKINDLPP